MRTSLGALLAFGLAGLQLIAVLIVVFTSYVTSERALLSHAQTLLQDVGVNAAEHSKGFLSPAKGAAELAARLAEYRILASEDPMVLERFLFQQLLVGTQFSALYSGDENGDFVFVMRTPGPTPYMSKIISEEDGKKVSRIRLRDKDFNLVDVRIDENDRFDPRTRPWYQRAKLAKDTIWTDPYIFFTAQQPGITLASPIEDSESQVRGVVGVDIEISSISEFLSQLRIGYTGKALIINHNGDVIAHANQEYLKTLNDDGTQSFVNIADFKDPIAREAFGSLRDGFDPDSVATKIPATFTHDGKVYIAAVIPMINDDLPWTIGVYAPELDFIGELKKSRLLSIWIAVLVAVATGLAGLALANYIYRPVRAFAVRSTLVAQGEVDPAQPMPGTYKELSHANNMLVQQIVQRKKAEREYGQTFDLSSRGMAQIAPETGALLKVNSKFCEITGYDAQDIDGMSYADFVHPDDAHLLGTGFISHSGVLADRHEIRFIRKNGDIIDVAVNAILIRDHNGKLLHSVVTLDDITESKKKENQIAHLNRDLFLMARGHTMGQMASGLAHELNQPLAAIAQNADTAKLLANDDDENTDELIEILTEIESQSLRAGEIIRALRAFITKDAGTASPFDVRELIEQAIRLLQPEAIGAGVTIITKLNDLPKAVANRIQIAQVIVNLLRNAVEAIDGSDVAARKITISASRIGEDIKVSIADTGPGIKPGFPLFTQFETTKANGMGFGLTLCRTMIEANDGVLWQDETYTKGARFCFTLPGQKTRI